MKFTGERKKYRTEWIGTKRGQIQWNRYYFWIHTSWDIVSMDIGNRSLLYMDICSRWSVRFCKMAETRKVAQTTRDGRCEFNEALFGRTRLLLLVFFESCFVTCSWKKTNFGFKLKGKSHWNSRSLWRYRRFLKYSWPRPIWMESGNNFETGLWFSTWVGNFEIRELHYSVVVGDVDDVWRSWKWWKMDVHGRGKESENKTN
jgi:hypothetical protein